jgi:hypothetical protein
VKDAEKVIVCMIDLSASSYPVLQWAAEDAAVYNTGLVIVYHYRLKKQPNAIQHGSLKRQLEEEAHQRFDSMKTHVQKLNMIPYTFSPEVGFETDRVEFHIHSRNVKLVVLNRDAAKTKEQQAEWSELLARIEVPVLIIP